MRTLEFTTAEGRTCCATDNLENLCVHCRAAYDALVAEARQTTAPPDPYAPGLAKLRAASDSRISTFERQWRASRKQALENERGTRIGIDDTDTPRFTTCAADDLKPYAPPDPYAAGIRRLQEHHR